MKVNVNIDGLPLVKSSNSCFWAILGSIVADFYTEPFEIGVYHGLTKPNDVNEFLRPFVNDFIGRLQLGVNVDGKIVQVTLNALILDAPAKSFVTCIKGHTGYFACPKCIQEGEYINNRMSFPETHSTLRSDSSFRQKSQPEHHIGYSCLEELLMDIIDQVPIDYMHCICLGIVRRLVWFWVRGRGNVRLADDKIETLSDNLISMKDFIPCEFARKPRSVKDVQRWKATESRQFLLYTGIVVLKEILPSDHYIHFLSLSISIRILIDEELYLNASLKDYADKLIRWFVENVSNFYSPEYISYNFHVATHLPTCTELFGILEKFSSFSFENHLQKIKQLVKSCSKPLHKLVNRILEKNKKLVTNYPKSYPVIRSNRSGELYLQFSGFRISTKKTDNCCLLMDGTIAVVIKVYRDRNTPILTVKHFQHSEPYFTKPCNSKKFSIVVVQQASLSVSRQINPSEIKRKCLQIQRNNNYVIIPLLHENN